MHQALYSYVFLMSKSRRVLRVNEELTVRDNEFRLRLIAFKLYLTRKNASVYVPEWKMHALRVRSDLHVRCASVRTPVPTAASVKVSIEGMDRLSRGEFMNEVA